MTRVRASAMSRVLRVRVLESTRDLGEETRVKRMRDQVQHTLRQDCKSKAPVPSQALPQAPYPKDEA